MRMLACVAVLVVTLPVAADETKMPFDKLPQAVKDGFKKRFPDAQPTEAAKETTDDKKVVYEITFKEKGKNRGVTMSDAGALVGIEKEIDKVTDGKEKLEYYEALLETADKKTVEVEVAADGTIKKTEEKKDEKK